MPAKTFTSTAALAMASAVAFAPKSNCACSTTGLRPTSKRSKTPCGAAFSGFACASRVLAVAPLIAPHCVWPRKRMNFTPRAPTLNSKLPTREPSALVNVLPALRSTKRSPGLASKRISTGARESAQPTTEAKGLCPRAAMAARSSTELPFFHMSAVPATKRLFPAMRFFSASSGGTLASLAVRKLVEYRFAGIFERRMRFKKRRMPLGRSSTASLASLASLAAAKLVAR
mmetsp:Transcript_116168/g.227873  ORF Transcript_116168/g.227873 Transcript_116168/m.227873 type:complete len:230 (-) Transcript_116168:56-745(-)